MTRIGGREASERKGRVGEDEKQPVMAQLAARWRRSHLVKLVREKGPKKRFVQNREGLLRWAP